MSKPDLSTPDGRKAYRAELFTVARGWRWTGLTLVVLSAIGMVLKAQHHMSWTSPLGAATIACLVVGWALVAVGIVTRTRYHKRRMTGWPGEE